MSKILKSGKYCGEKISYPDGIGCCIWMPFPDGDENSGLAYDFSYDDINDIINLLQKMKKVEPEIFKDDTVSDTSPSKNEEV